MTLIKIDGVIVHAFLVRDKTQESVR